MKKISILLAFFAVLSFSSCNSCSQRGVGAEEAEVKKVQLSESIIKRFDDRMAEIREDASLTVAFREGSFVIPEESRKVKPDYLLSPSLANQPLNAEQRFVLSQFLRVDMAVAKAYDMPIDDFKKAISKLAINDANMFYKEFDEIDMDAPDRAEKVVAVMNKIYDDAIENGTLNFFVKPSVVRAVEILYVLSQSGNVIISVLDDSYVTGLCHKQLPNILSDVNELLAFFPDLKPFSEALTPLQSLNAYTREELVVQLEELRETIEVSRNTLLAI